MKTPPVLRLKPQPADTLKKKPVKKMDLVDYSEERFKAIEKDIKELAESLGLYSVKIIPVSATDGGWCEQIADAVGTRRIGLVIKRSVWSKERVLPSTIIAMSPFLYEA